jgi:hypothetical protein
MKRSLLIGALAGLLVFGAAAESLTAQAKMKPADMSGAKPVMGQQAQGPEAAPAVPTGELALGAVRLPQGLMADGKSLPAGTYQVKLTPQEANPPAVGQTPTYERWVEFLQGGQAKGREVVSIVNNVDIGKVAEGKPPAPNSYKVETLKGGDYVRVWINRGGNHYLIHLVNPTNKT